MKGLECKYQHALVQHANESWHASQQDKGTILSENEPEWLRMLVKSLKTVTS